MTDAAQVDAFIERIGTRRHPRQQRGRRRRARSAARSRRSPTDDWHAVVDANLTSTFVCTRAVVPGMKARRLRPDRQHLLGRRPQRQPHRHPGVRERQGRADRLHPPDGARARAASGSPSTASRPGSCSRTRPSIASGRATARRASSALLETIATRRLGEPEDIANGVLFFVAEESSWVTGQVISIDGGHSIF